MLYLISLLVDKLKDTFLPTLFKYEVAENEHAQGQKAVNPSQATFHSN